MVSLPIFEKITEIVDRKGVRAFVVGGFVRDYYLRRPCTDVDIVVVGSGIVSGVWEFFLLFILVD